MSNLLVQQTGAGPPNKRNALPNQYKPVKPKPMTKIEANMARLIEKESIPDYPRAWCYPMLPWGAPRTNFPQSRLRNQTPMLIWEIFTLAWVLYIAVEVPYRAGFGFADEFPVCQWSWKVAIDWIGNAVFLIDIVVQMHCAIFVGNPHDGQWDLIDHLANVRKAYFKAMYPWNRSLLWDCLCAFPFLQIGCAIWFARDGRYEYFNAAVAVMLLSLLRLTKLLRLWKISEMIEHVQRNHAFYGNFVAVGKLLAILFFAAHYLGCIWFTISPKEDDATDGWIYNEAALLPRNKDNWLTEWIATMYWAITTMTTIGYGDIIAYTLIERIFAMFAMVLGSSYFAWLAGTVTGILSKGSAGTERFFGFLEEVRQYMDIKRFSEDVKKMVMVFYGLKYPTQLIFNDQEIMDSLPKGLRKRMQAETYMDSIEAVPLFAELSEPTKVEVCNAFETYYCSKEEKLCAEDEEPDAMFIVRHGDVLLSNNGERIAVANRGVLFGEVAMLGMTESGRRLRTAVSLSECELLKMSAERLRTLMVTHGDLRYRFRQLAQRHIRLLETESLNPNSPVHDDAKRVYIYANWQEGKVPPQCWLPGKIPPPVVSAALEEQRIIQTAFMLRFHTLRGLPIIEAPNATVTVRLVVEWDGKVESSKTVTYAQGAEVPLAWDVILKHRHTTREKVTDKPDVQIKVIFVRWNQGAMGPTAQLGFPNANGDGGGGLKAPNFNTPLGPVLKPPHTRKQIAEIKIPVLELCGIHDHRLGQKKVRYYHGKWTVGRDSESVSVAISGKIMRELPPNSIIRSRFRSMWNRRRREKEPKHDGSLKGMLSQEGLMKKNIFEIKEGVKNVLGKGVAGKSGVEAASFENMQEKATDNMIQRLREMKDQINEVLSYCQNFEMHMNDEMMLAVETLDKRLEILLKEQASMKKHLVEVQNRREQHALELKQAIQHIDSQSRARELMIIDMLQQIAKKQGLMLSTVPPIQVQVVPPRTTGTPAQMTDMLGEPTGGAGVGLLLGQVSQPDARTGKPRVFIQVQGVLPNGAAEISGAFRAGDEVIRIDGVDINGRSLQEAKRLILGPAGSRLEVGVIRPDTGDMITVPLMRQH